MQRDESLARSNAIDAICDQFEQECLAGALPRIEDILAEHADVDRLRLLRELLLIELEVRRSNGEAPSAADYATRFSEQTDVIDAALQTIATRATNQEETETVDVSFNSADETYVPSDPAKAKTIVPGSGTELAQPSSSEPGSQQFGDYELLHEIARGGMGVVYKARQTKLNRIVALKMIKAGELAGHEEIQRFHAEAEAAAALDHPGIVPIYEVGEQDGQHFFSMGFVDGSGLDAKLKDGPLPPKEAAELIKTIAEAVQYAHEKGIVHRDLKPANVLIDADDKPKITDFGLAKNIAGDSGMTATGQVMGTPSYMPPEQAAGNIEQIGPLSDVYSLGAMLYATLTGRPPFQAANVMETLQQVLERDPVSPRTLNPAVDKDLETICLKCLEKEVVKRYASARDLADELDRFLAHKPIHARPIGSFERGLRWCKRNRMATALIALVAVIAVSSPIVAAIQFGLQKEANDNLGLAKSNLKLANDNSRKYKAAKILADQKVIELEASLKRETAQKKRANGNRDRADAVVQKFVMEIAREGGPLSQYPGTQPVRKKLLQMGQEYYDGLFAENPESEFTHRLAAAAFHRAVVFSQLSGDKRQAIAAYERAKQLQERLCRLYPQQGRHRDNLSSICNNLGALYDQTGQARLSLAMYRQSLRIKERRSREDPADAAHSFGEADSHNNIALVLSRQAGSLVEAEKSYQKAITILKRLCNTGENEEYRAHLAATYGNLGSLYAKTGRDRQAATVFRTAMSIRQKLAKGSTVATRQAELADSQYNLGAILSKNGEPNRGLLHCRQSLAIRAKLAKENPQVARYRESLATSHHTIGELHSRMGQYGAAFAEFVQAENVWATLVHQNPSVPGYQHHLATTLMSIGDCHRRNEKHDEALKVYQRAATLIETLVSKSPGVAQYQDALASSHFTIAVIQNLNGKPIESLAGFRKALKVRKQLVKEWPTKPIFRLNLAKTYQSIGIHHGRTSKSEDAIAAYRLELQTWESLSRDYPNVESLKVSTVAAHGKIIRLCASMNRFSDALAEIAKATVIQEALVRRYPDNVGYLKDLAKSHTNAGMLFFKTAERVAAIESFSNGLGIMRKLVRKEPMVLSHQINLGGSYVNIGNLYRDSGKPRDALREYGLAIPVLVACKNEAGPQFLRNAHSGRAMVLDSLARYNEAAVDWEKAAALDDGRMKPAFLQRLGLSLARSGQHNRAAGLVSQLVKRERKPSVWVNCARVFAIAATEVGRNNGSSEENSKLENKYAKASIMILNLVGKSGFFRNKQNRPILLNDSDFNSLRHRAEFREFAKSVGVELPAWARRPRSATKSPSP